MKGPSISREVGSWRIVIVVIVVVIVVVVVVIVVVVVVVVGKGFKMNRSTRMEFSALFSLCGMDRAVSPKLAWIFFFFFFFFF